MVEAAQQPKRRKRIAMVHPKFPPSFWSFGFIKEIGGFKTVMPPLGLATLAALTPEEYDVVIVDENIEEIDFEINADIIVLSSMAIQEERLFEVADEFRRLVNASLMGTLAVAIATNMANILPSRAGLIMLGICAVPCPTSASPTAGASGHPSHASTSPPGPSSSTDTRQSGSSANA